MNTQIFHLTSMTSMVIEGLKSSSNFSVPIGWSVDTSPSKLCVSLSLYFSLTLHLVLLLSPYLPLLLHANIYLHTDKCFS